MGAAIAASADERIPMPTLVKVKVEAAVAGGNGGAASYFHPMGVAPVLGTAIGCANIEVRKFFFHVIILLFLKKV